MSRRYTSYATFWQQYYFRSQPVVVLVHDCRRDRRDGLSSPLHPTPPSPLALGAESRHSLSRATKGFAYSSSHRSSSKDGQHAPPHATMTASATLDGTFRLQPSRSTVLSGSSSGGGGDGLPRAPGSSSEDGPHPPKAILLKLTAAAYEQIRALNAAPAGSCSGQLRLEVPAAAGYNNSSGGGDRPMVREGSQAESRPMGRKTLMLIPPVCTLPVPPHWLALVQPRTSSCHGGPQDRSPPTGDADASPTRWEQQSARRRHSSTSTAVCGTGSAASVHHLPRFNCGSLLFLLDA